MRGKKKKETMSVPPISIIGKPDGRVSRGIQDSPPASAATAATATTAATVLKLEAARKVSQENNNPVEEEEEAEVNETSFLCKASVDSQNVCR